MKIRKSYNIFFKKIKGFIHRNTRNFFYTYLHEDDPLVFNKTANQAEEKTWKWINSHLKILKKILKKKITILEVGCVNGRNLIMSGHKDINYIGLDLNKKAIDSGNSYIKKKKITNIKLYRGSINKFNFQNINLIVNISLCIYLSPKELLIYFAKIINEKTDFAIFVDFFSRDVAFKDYYYYHNLNQFLIFKKKYFLRSKKIYYPPWKKKNCDVRFIFLYKKDLKKKISKFFSLEKFFY